MPARRRKTRHEHAVRARRDVQDLHALALRSVSTLELISAALEIALAHSITAYDACYVALAEALGCTLLTADARLARAPGPRCTIDLL